ncbi:SKA complex subunit 2 isoform X2 [Salvelinus sp. IW2-2015]|uniref:SKA complex subunit 2 isoform X2 n=1 Tax=Salvelinus sp. IW2-2015 TaxID=2691554 RepID=UPI000CDF83AB|nr:spindle and kinetochore-associated protein 2 isoform X2 [Salvelinus alpinus]
MNQTSGFIFTGLPGECKLFNMEIAVDKLEAMFQKAEADMEYMEKRLRLEFLTNAPENGTTEENPVKLLENLSAIKVRHAALCTQVQEIAAEQKQSMDSIRAHLDTTVQLVQQLQQTADVEIPPLTEMEQEPADFLGLSVNENTAELLMSMEPSAQEQPQSVVIFVSEYGMTRITMDGNVVKESRGNPNKGTGLCTDRMATEAEVTAVHSLEVVPRVCRR